MAFAMGDCTYATGLYTIKERDLAVNPKQIEVDYFSFVEQIRTGPETGISGGAARRSSEFTRSNSSRGSKGLGR